MSEVNTVAKVLVSLHKRGDIHLDPDFIADLERKFGFPERSLDIAVDGVLVPKPRVEVVGFYYKVYHDNCIYYINNKLISKQCITTAYMNSSKSMFDASVVIDTKLKIYVKNAYGIQQITDAFFETP